MEMAQHTVVRLVDDLDESEATQTITFGLNGKTYEIDLSDANAAKLREALEPFQKAARVVSRRGRKLGAVQTNTVAAPATPKASRAPRTEAQVKRAWLAANGYSQVAGRRGRFTDEQDLAWANHQRREADVKIDAEAATVAQESPAAPVVVDAPVAPRKGGGRKGKETADAPQAAGQGGGKNTRVTGLTGAQVGSLEKYTEGLVVEAGETWALLKGYPVDVVRVIEDVRANTVFPREELGMKRALAFVVKKVVTGKGVRVTAGLWKGKGNGGSTAT